MWPSDSTTLENSRSLQCFVSHWKIPQRAVGGPAFSEAQSTCFCKSQGTPSCLRTSLINLVSWGEDMRNICTATTGEFLWWGTKGMPPCTGPGINDHLSLLHLVMKTSLACQPRHGNRLNFSPKQQDFSFPQEWVYQERRTKEFKEATGATHHSVNITQCMVHVLAHTMAQWCSSHVFWLHWPWNAYCCILRFCGP